MFMLHLYVEFDKDIVFNTDLYVFIVKILADRQTYNNRNSKVPLFKYR